MTDGTEGHDFQLGMRKLREAAEAFSRSNDPEFAQNAAGKAQKQVASRNIENERIDWGNPATFIQKDHFRLAHFPLSDGGHGGTTVFFDAHNNHAHTVESTAEVGEQSARVRFWLDGKVVFDESVATQPPNVSVEGLNFGKFNDCLAAQGIAAWVGYAASTVCAGVCAGTAGTGCAPCIAALAGFGGGVIGTCVYKAWE